MRRPKGSKAKISQLEMWELYCQGYSLNEIGAEAGLTGEMVRKLIQNHPQYQQVKLERKLNKYSTDEIKELVTQGKTKKEIGEILGLTHTQLVVAFKTDVELAQLYQSEQNPNVKQHREDCEVIWQLHQQGLTYRQIADQLGRSCQYISDRIQEHPKYRDKNQRKDDQGSMIRFLLLSGFSIATIAEQLGLSVKTIKRYLK